MDDRLKRFANGALQGSLPLRTEFILSGDGETSIFDSTEAREMWFVAHHALHHQFTIKSIIKEIKDEPTRALLEDCLPGNFGKAPATVNHDKNEG